MPHIFPRSFYLYSENQWSTQFSGYLKNAFPRQFMTERVAGFDNYSR